MSMTVEITVNGDLIGQVYVEREDKFESVDIEHDYKWDARWFEVPANPQDARERSNQVLKWEHKRGRLKHRYSEGAPALARKVLQALED